MLRELHISNLAVIEDAHLELGPGLNVFTGETGAGKSLVLGAIALLLGERGSARLLRSGAKEGRVTGVFDVCDASVRRAIQREGDLAEDDDAEFSADGTLLVARKLNAAGRSSATLNGRPTTISMLRRVGEHLVDLHGWSDGATGSSGSSGGGGVAGGDRGVTSEALQLLRPARQLELLDSFAGHLAMRSGYRDLHAKFQMLSARLHALREGAALRTERLDLDEFQAAEIDDVAPEEGEFDELQARHRVLSNLERVLRDATAVYESMYESEGSAVDRLQYAMAVLRELVELDSDLAEIRELTEQATAMLQDAAFSLGRYISRLELNPEEYAEVTDRLNSLNRLIAKYGCGTIEGVFEHRQALARRIDAARMESSDETDIVEAIDRVQEQLDASAVKLRTSRMKAARKLKPLIEREMRDLAMPHAEFDVSFEPMEAVESATGSDRIEMMVRTNPGQPMLPVRHVASGGELSRLMLALKSVLAQSEPTSVLVFDEADARVGGRLGSVIGEKLRRLAGQHQVLCITHLPQIAAYADQHYRIEKATVSRGKQKGETRTTVSMLNDDESRIAELADMLAGKDSTKTTLAQAREMFDHARNRSAASAADAEVTVKKKRRKKPAR